MKAYIQSGLYPWKKLWIAAAVLTVAGTTAACAGGNLAGTSTQTGNQTEAQSEDVTSASNDNGAESAEEAQQTASETQSDAIVDGYQMIGDYGLCGPGNQRAYQMSALAHPAVEEDGVKAELLAAVYAGGEWRFRVRIEDCTVELMAPEKAKIVEEQEAENQRLQEQGQEPIWDSTYFTVEGKNGPMYGRSTYQDEIIFDKSNEKNREYTLHVTGNGISEAGYSANGATTTWDYNLVPEGGPALMYSEYRVAGELSTDHPDGTYSLHVPAIAQTLDFTLEPVPVYDSPESIPGVLETADQWVWARGKLDEDRIETTVYTWPKDESRSFKTFLSGVELEFAQAGQAGTCDPLHLGVTSLDRESLAVVPRYQPVYADAFVLPENTDQGSYTLSVSRTQLVSLEQSEPVKLVIPEESEPIDQDIRFFDGTVRLLSIERLKEPVYFGNINGKDEMRPAVRIALKTIDLRKDLKMAGIMGRRTGDDMYTMGVLPVYGPDDTALTPTGGQALHVFYEEGDREVEIYLQNPQYLVEGSLRIPVVIEEHINE